MKFFKLKDNIYNVKNLKGIYVICSITNQPEDIFGIGFDIYDESERGFEMETMSLTIRNLSILKAEFEFMMNSVDRGFVNFDYLASKKSAFGPEDEE